MWVNCPYRLLGRVWLRLKHDGATATVLVPFGVPQEGVNAQGADGPAVRTITNIAEATWDADGSRRRVESNPVRFDVSTAPPTPGRAAATPWRAPWFSASRVVGPGVATVTRARLENRSRASFMVVPWKRSMGFAGAAIAAVFPQYCTTTS